MSRMRTDRKPPLAKSPIRLRPRRVLRSNATASFKTPPGSLRKSQKPMNPTWEGEESGVLRPEYRTISCELWALSKMVRDELGDGQSTIGQTFPSSGICIFERGRFYEEYSARRNERLNNKRKTSNNNISKGERLGEPPLYKAAAPGESSKRGRGDTEKTVVESPRKSVSAAYCPSAMEGTTAAAAATLSSNTPRYMLRSMSKENRKPPAPLPAAVLSVARRARRI